ncbi:hypothetical protein CVIRNUC_009903 [Coccomyxa viridis]|uniref:Uncharacterized protein n=1 Tax=Coccomyxa viridis TaxID=1274662 RepID=A0AAV1IHA3_9CHLO|nr:hypothetical protein CVIRNUC_009903 [Coccomyxa viridis]
MSDRHSAAHSLLATSVSQEYGEVTEALRPLGQAIDVVARAVFALSTATPAKAASVLGAEDIISALKQAMADNMLQPGPSAREDGISPPQKQATVADVLPPWKIPAEESNEQPQQQPTTINHYEDTITRGMALTALRQAQQVASEFASLREHVDLPGIVEADGQAMVARRPLPGSRCLSCDHALAQVKWHAF